MSLDISSKLMLVPNLDVYKHFENELTLLPLYSILEDVGLEYCSPWFDADPKDWVVGVEIKAPTFSDLLDWDSNSWTELTDAAEKLDKVFGVGASHFAYLMACEHVY